MAQMWSALMNVPCELRRICTLLPSTRSVDVSCTQLTGGDVEFDSVLNDFLPSGDSIFLFNYLNRVPSALCSCECSHDFYDLGSSAL